MNLILRCCNCQTKNRIPRKVLNKINQIKCGSCKNYITNSKVVFKRYCPYCKGTHESIGDGQYSKCLNCKMPLVGNKASRDIITKVLCYYCKKENECSGDNFIAIHISSGCQFCRKKLFEVEGEKEITVIDRMSGLEFEQMLSALFTSLGYSVKTTNISGDQGADLIINKSKKRIAIQAKRYKNKNVGNKAVQEVLSGKYYYQCDEAWVVTNSYFTESAYSLAKKADIKLIDRTKLIELIGKVK